MRTVLLWVHYGVSSGNFLHFRTTYWSHPQGSRNIGKKLLISLRNNPEERSSHCPRLAVFMKE